MFDTMDEAALIDRIAMLERTKSAAAAEQAVLTARLADPERLLRAYHQSADHATCTPHL